MFALGFGLGTKNKKGEWLETFFPAPILSPEREIVDVVKKNTSYTDGNQDLALSAKDITECAREIEDTEQKKLLGKLAQAQTSMSPGFGAD